MNRPFRQHARVAVHLICFLIASISSSAQTSSLDLRFGGHRLGEQADAFFKTARAAESQQLSRNYCKALLEDDKTKEKVQQAENAITNGGVFVLTKGDFSLLLDVDNCRQVMAALDGKQANVGTRLASELGKGSVLFASGRVRAFNLNMDTSYAETVSDMARRFGAPGQENTVLRVFNSGPVHQEMRWERDRVLAAVWKDQFSGSARAFVGFLEQPYESFLRGNPASEATGGAPWWTDSAEACKATTQGTPKEAPAQGTRKRLSPSGPGQMGKFLRKIQPAYPESARQNRLEGVVALAAVIDPCGYVVELRPLSGPEELVPATITALKLWRYRPVMSSGQPTAFVTQVQVTFVLSHQTGVGNVF